MNIRKMDRNENQIVIGTKIASQTKYKNHFAFNGTYFFCSFSYAWIKDQLHQNQLKPDSF